jgi:hypothetical protein
VNNPLADKNFLSQVDRCHAHGSVEGIVDFIPQRNISHSKQQNQLARDRENITKQQDN